MTLPAPPPVSASRTLVTPDKLTEVLRRAGLLTSGSVVDIAWEPVGHGQAADNFRLRPSYSGGDGPTTLIGKFPSSDERSARMGSNGLYLGEVSFYRDLAPRLDISVPRAVTAEIQPDGASFVILLEDLSPAHGADQLTGCSADQAALALEQAAVLHAQSWHDASLASLEWLGTVPAGLRSIADALPRLLDRLEASFSDVVTPESMATLRQLTHHVPAWKHAIERPTCLWHQDFRVDNLLFDAKGGDVPVAVLDWQTVSFGPGIADVSLLLGGSLTIEDRRSNERELVRGYHQALLANGVEDYGLDQCWDDYRAYAVHGVSNGINGPTQVKRSERGDQMWGVWIERHTQQARDLDSYEALEASS